MQKYCKGVTLVELIVVLTIVGILTMMGAPSFNDAIKSTRLATSINELATSLSLARNEAIKRNRRVVVRTIGAVDNPNWENGWQVFVDADVDGVPSANAAACAVNGDCILQIHEALSNGYTLRFNASGNAANKDSFVRYSASGGVSARGSFYLCSDATLEPYTAKLLIINAIGRPRTGLDTNQNGIPEGGDGSDITSCASPF
jgi:type IV fimbrial biogenesis protein FimT